MCAQAAAYYKQAARLVCSSGNPYNQLAVLAYYTGDELRAVYYYARSLAVAQPFATTRENLLLLFEKNRGRCAQLSAATPVDGSSSSVTEAAKSTSLCFVRLQGLLFDRINVDQYPAVSARAFGHLRALVRCEGAAAFLQVRLLLV